MSTQWTVRASAVHDALCLLNIWTGDPLYTENHPGVYERWAARLHGTPIAAFGRLAQVIREEEKGIISAKLNLYFSAVQPVTLSDLIEATLRPEAMRKVLQNTPYYDEHEWLTFERIRENLLIVLQFLENIGFEAEYHADVAPSLDRVCQETRQVLERFDVVAEVEAELGTRLAEPQIDVLVLAYTAPHGIKLVGSGFVTASAWPPQTTAFVAAHELMHPPYDVAVPEVRAAVDTLQNDSFLVERFEAHDPAFGYNTWDRFIEENCVRALDLTISERLGVAKPAWNRWTTDDGGMHVLAAVLHPLLKARTDKSVPFGVWFAREVQQGGLRPGSIEGSYRALERRHGTTAR